MRPLPGKPHGAHDRSKKLACRRASEKLSNLESASPSLRVSINYDFPSKIEITQWGEDRLNIDISKRTIVTPSDINLSTAKIDETPFADTPSPLTLNTAPKWRSVLLKLVEWGLVLLNLWVHFTETNHHLS